MCLSGMFPFTITYFCVMITQVLDQTFTTRGKITNSIIYFCVTITQVLVQTFNTRGKYITLPVSQLEQGGAWRC